MSWAERAINAVSMPVVRRVMHFYWRFARGMTLGVRAAVLDDAERVLLIRHTYTKGWHLPGGGVEVGETMLDALKRELREEVHVRLTGEPVLHGLFFNPQGSRRDHVAVYVVRDFEQLRPKLPDHEIAEIGFFPLEGLPEGTTRGTRARLIEIIDEEPVSPVW
ncbi:NUDIX domain-containing protein [Chelatococcus sp. SYSU_G07232]|uniref:NUDIX domain-containing protein n=1 Tax=Chelatococcus albus TaxID=3047466 RepID=A0ABT7AK35_9HYPH|nr:NUDIX domain-containing protein [Chelatococcus sp. SYSU_G07232]MDJ1159337.1 NUDIX domain-containing protein [Chelatococcus sp. SYSU_G07232]